LHRRHGAHRACAAGAQSHARCTGYGQIIEAIELAAERLRQSNKLAVQA
jgi:aerobic-type carbon monoxide dehydrogenase small subunit (CoxS/CutS family)